MLSTGPGCVQAFNQDRKASIVIDTLVQSCKHVQKTLKSGSDVNSSFLRCLNNVGKSSCAHTLFAGTRLIGLSTSCALRCRLRDGCHPFVFDARRLQSRHMHLYRLHWRPATFER